MQSPGFNYNNSRFQNQVVLGCTGTRKRHMHDLQITLQDFRKRLGLLPVSVNVALRQLRWLGHVARLPGERWEVKLLRGWLRPEASFPMARGRRLGRPRPSKRQQLWTRIKSVMKYTDIPSTDWQTHWMEIAQDRKQWKKLIGKFTRDAISRASEDAWANDMGKEGRWAVWG